MPGWCAEWRGPTFFLVLDVGVPAPIHLVQGRSCAGCSLRGQEGADAMRLHLPGLCLRSFASVHLWGGGCPRNKFWKFVDRGRLSVAYVKALGFRIHPFRISSVNYFIEEFLGFADHKFT